MLFIESRQIPQVFIRGGSKSCGAAYLRAENPHDIQRRKGLVLQRRYAGLGDKRGTNVVGRTVQLSVPVEELALVSRSFQFLVLPNYFGNVVPKGRTNLPDEGLPECLDGESTEQRAIHVEKVGGDMRIVDQIRGTIDGPSKIWLATADDVSEEPLIEGPEFAQCLFDACDFRPVSRVLNHGTRH